MRSLYSILGSIVSIIASYLVVNFLLEIFYISKFSPSEVGMARLGAYLYAILAFPLLTIAVSVKFFKTYGKLNVRGIAFGGVFGFWLYTLVNNQLFIPYSPYSSIIQIVIDCIPLLCILIGIKAVPQKLSDYKLKYTMLGMGVGCMLSYIIVFSMRAVNNTFTGYISLFRSSEIPLVLGVIAVSGIAGWFLSEGMRKWKMNS
ncbi:hypothetical protein [Paenibacillus arenosi]|uniref:Uncharacterized protein n=1 Tax=Paenibacillus arenosi TaxID=2774142 RepID=A0ABR9B2P6_9BACL|nr:hypothetical protein [Paenibacillus arenosi]MBD8499730.1 hypothetical protein [Paenibacillus arenosi]